MFVGVVTQLGEQVAVLALTALQPRLSWYPISVVVALLPMTALVELIPGLSMAVSTTTLLFFCVVPTKRTCRR
ncbi:hypothetical protein [Streptomyces sp. NPDC005303]|uniref:hypothetical protein n=1 Tax=Streptomyces sp. NPDC005303 TaxID=3155713 RepID=UPI0033AECF3E